jgi:hypothetical protein
MAGLCEHGNEVPGSMKTGNFFTSLANSTVQESPGTMERISLVGCKEHVTRW